MSASLDAFAAQFHAVMADDPNYRVAMGIDRDLGQLPDPSLRAGQERVAVARALLTELQAVDRSELDFDQQLDLDLAGLLLERRIHSESLTFNGSTMRAQCPRAGDDIGDGLFLIFANDPRPDPVRLADVTARLEAVPAYLDALLDRLDTPVARWVGMDVEKVQGLKTLLDSLLGWSEEVSWSEHGRLSSACDTAWAAMQSYVTRLQALPTTDRFALEPADAQRIVDLKAVGMTLSELRDMAASYLSRTSGEIETLRQRLVAKYELPDTTTAAELQQFLAGKYRVQVVGDDMDTVLARYEQERGRVLDWIRERDLFPVFEEQDMRILRTPSFMEPSIPAGAMMSPPPFRQGVRTSLVYLTLKPELLDEHTEIGIPSMMIHEGIPGHHLQLATAGLHPSVFRKHFDAMEHAEGWTTMLEDYMLDEGFMGDLTDEARFCGKRDLSRIGARVAIDLFFMTGDRAMLDVGVECDLSSDDPFVAAGNLLQAVTGFVPGRVQAELNWYSQERGYPLSYLTGNTLVWQLKRDLADANRGRLEGRDLDRAFHQVYLESGNMPVTYLRKVFEHAGML
ncbi:MAG: DUF885 domain-containing protein [Myxococcales bacterium]|nr:DUF885 domain-containing protein [Myxococcales bacterium]